MTWAAQREESGMLEKKKEKKRKEKKRKENISGSQERLYPEDSWLNNNYVLIVSSDSLINLQKVANVIYFCVCVIQERMEQEQNTQ